MTMVEAVSGRFRGGSGDIMQNSSRYRSTRCCVSATPTLEELFSDVSDKATRNEQIHEAIRLYRYTLNEVGDYVGLLYSTISMIAKRVNEAKKS